MVVCEIGTNRQVQDIVSISHQVSSHLLERKKMLEIIQVPHHACVELNMPEIIQIRSHLLGKSARNHLGPMYAPRV